LVQINIKLFILSIKKKNKKKFEPILVDYLRKYGQKSVGLIIYEIFALFFKIRRIFA